MAAGQSVYQTLTVSYVDAQLAASDLTPHEITLVDAHRDRIQQSRQVSEPSLRSACLPACFAGGRALCVPHDGQAVHSCQRLVHACCLPARRVCDHRV